MEKLGNLVSSRRFILAFAAAFALLSALLIPTHFAWGSIADDINAWLCGVLRDWCNWIFAAQTDVMRSLGANGVLSAPFETMLTSAGDVSMYDIARGAWQVAVLPIGCGVLGLVFTLKLIEISQRMDGNQSLPGVKEVAFLLVFFAVFLFLIQHSFDLMAAIYEVIGLAIDRVEGLFGTGGALDMAAVSIVTGDDDLSALLALLIVAVISWLVVLIAYIVALVVCWARRCLEVHRALLPYRFPPDSIGTTSSQVVSVIRSRSRCRAPRHRSSRARAREGCTWPGTGARR